MSKVYVVWEGREPGVYESWEDCLEQVNGYPGAKYKSFNSIEAAVEAYRADDYGTRFFLNKLSNARNAYKTIDYTGIPAIRLDAIAVDGACSRNPGPMEYRCVRVVDGVEIFHQGPYAGGTNNIAEYLAIIHAAALLAQRGDTTTPIYTDSRTARAWLSKGHSCTKVTPTAENVTVLNLLARADAWLATHCIANPILVWNTDEWGEIPADFGRK